MRLSAYVLGRNGATEPNITILCAYDAGHRMTARLPHLGWFGLANINRTPQAQEWRGDSESDLVMERNLGRLLATGRRAYYRSLDITNIRSTRRRERTAAGHPSQARRESGQRPIAAEVMGMTTDEIESQIRAIPREGLMVLLQAIQAVPGSPECSSPALASPESALPC